MDYYAPMQMYIILAIGVACYYIVVSRASLRHPSSKRFGILIGIDIILFISWVPLVVHQMSLLIAMSPNPPYHDVSGTVSRYCRQVAYFFHVLAVFTFPYWMSVSFAKLMTDIDREKE